MRRRLFSVATAVTMCLSSAAAVADAPVSPRHVTGWEAVGKLTINKRAMCTGALIASDMVLTAAHCLFDPHTGRKVRPHRIQFEAGLDGASVKATRRVSGAIIHPDYKHSHGGANDVATDLAIVKLSSPINASEIPPFAVDARPERGDALGVISYTNWRQTTPLWQHPCDVIARKGDVLVMNCEVDFGASGAPVFVVQGGSRPRLVSVVSSKAAIGNKPVAVGTVVEDALRVLLGRAG